MKLLDAARAFQAEWIGIELGRCLNFRHRMEFCDACVRACPREAVTASIDDVAIASEQCNNCALCVADCPTGVFEHDYFSSMQLVAWANGKSFIELFCQIAGGETLTGRQARIPCHGVLDACTLAGLKAVGVKQIAVHGLEKCAECPTKVGGDRLRALVDAPPPSTPDIRIVVEDDAKPACEPPEDGAVQLGMNAEPEMDRRSFLVGLGRRTARAAAASTLAGLIEDESQEETASGDALAKKHVPDYHRAALTALFAGQVRGTSWFHDIQADDQCTGCQTCAVRCPTGALGWQDKGDRVALTYRTAACIGCGLCISVCPYDALSLSPQTDDAALRADRVTTLFTSRQLRCSACGAQFLPHDGDNRYCWVCKNERELDDEWLRMIDATGSSHDARS